MQAAGLQSGTDRVGGLSVANSMISTILRIEVFSGIRTVPRGRVCGAYTNTRSTLFQQQRTLMLLVRYRASCLSMKTGCRCLRVNYTYIHIRTLPTWHTLYSSSIHPPAYVPGLRLFNVMHSHPILARSACYLASDGERIREED